ncbi:hypothetical protein BM1_08467 [Bipolaris maydis]|nr:hypothetical protein BM1_08467 [Bipolaris maydis]
MKDAPGFGIVPLALAFSAIAQNCTSERSSMKLLVFAIAMYVVDKSRERGRLNLVFGRTIDLIGTDLEAGIASNVFQARNPFIGSRTTNIEEALQEQVPADGDFANIPNSCTPSLLPAFGVELSQNPVQSANV